jgi:multiple sugar transport system permease protein
MASPTAKKNPTAVARARKEAWMAYGLLSPALIVLIVFTLIPVIFGLYMSFHDWRGANNRGFVGLENYTRALAPESNLYKALITTLTYSLLSVPIQLGIALVLAYLLYQKLRGTTLFRLVMFLPYVTSTVASAAIWKKLYEKESFLGKLFDWPYSLLSQDQGVFQLIGKSMGIDFPTWFVGPSLAMVAVIVYTTWVFVGYDMTIFLAGLGNISTDVYEAAKIDGASGWQLFRRITLPLLSPTTFFLSLISIIGTFKAFNHIWVMTEGRNGTETASLLIYRTMYTRNEHGYAAALSFLLFTVILVVTIIQNRASEKSVNY